MIKNKKIKLLCIFLLFLLLNSISAIQTHPEFFINAFLIILLFIFLHIKGYLQLFDKTKFFNIDRRDIIKFYVLIYFIPLLLLLLLMLFSDGSNPSKEKIFTTFSQPSVYIFFKACILAPIIEEIFLRKLFIDEFIKLNKTNLGIFLSSLIFALFHLDLMYFLLYFLTGLAYSILYIKTKSIIITIMLHSLSNLGIMFMRYVLFGSLGYIIFLFFPFILLGAIIYYKKNIIKENEVNHVPRNIN